MDIDFDRLRSDLADDSYGAFYGGGFGGALMEAFDIESAFHIHTENMHPEICSRGDKIHCRWVILSII